MKQYNYQLSEWAEDKKALRRIVRQIEQYEGIGRGYVIKEDIINKCIVYAVFTTGEQRETDPNGLEDNPSYSSVNGNVCS